MPIIHLRSAPVVSYECLQTLGDSKAAAANELQPVRVSPGPGLGRGSKGLRRALLELTNPAAPEAEDQPGAEPQPPLQRPAAAAALGELKP